MAVQTTQNNLPQLLSPEDVAHIILVDVSTVYRYLKLKENPLPSFKISKNVIRIKKDELYSWMEKYAQKYGI